MTAIAPTEARMLPRVTDANRAFLTGGREGRLMVGRCCGCGRWALPPATSCPSCDGELRPEPVSGRARVWTWTVNAHAYHPDIPPPYIIAIVVLEEQDDLRLATNLVGCDGVAVEEGMEVEVVFEDHGEVFYPVFAPPGWAAGSAGSAAGSAGSAAGSAGSAAGSAGSAAGAGR